MGGSLCIIFSDLFASASSNCSHWFLNQLPATSCTLQARGDSLFLTFLEFWPTQIKTRQRFVCILEAGSSYFCTYGYGSEIHRGSSRTPGFWCELSSEMTCETPHQCTTSNAGRDRSSRWSCGTLWYSLSFFQTFSIACCFPPSPINLSPPHPNGLRAMARTAAQDSPSTSTKGSTACAKAVAVFGAPFGPVSVRSAGTGTVRCRNQPVPQPWGETHVEGRAIGGTKSEKSEGSSGMVG